ncbi:hypothetical protein JZ751_019753 [Albula glossodonta]|uniref:Uncharacterized protein n=1 Tax=Albula glossodonta TaxID=121402 RepID=A0A8T2MVI7_9TELE|nr:hypothetical protein JZ751_019753 [Albula glossodonta]
MMNGVRPLKTSVSWCLCDGLQEKARHGLPEQTYTALFSDLQLAGALLRKAQDGQPVPWSSGPICCPLLPRGWNSLESASVLVLLASQHC